MKKGFFILSFLLSTVLVNAQDVITFNSGEKVKAKVQEISDTEIKYKKFSNLDGPLIVKKKSDVASLVYENGEKEVFGNTTDETNKYTKSNKEGKSKNEAVKSDNDDNSSSQKIISPPKNDGISIAKVHKLNGLDIFCLSTPLIKYKIVFNSGDLLSDVDMKSILLGGLGRADVDEKMNKLSNAAYRKAQKEGKTIDALIYTGGNKALAISYVSEEVPAMPLAKVNKINNIEVYAFSEPATAKYDVVDEAKTKSGGLTSIATAGIVNSTIDDDITKMIERMNEKKIDAVIYSSGKRGVGIKFK